MKAGWKTRIDERRYFEEKRLKELERLRLIRAYEHQMHMQEIQKQNQDKWNAAVVIASAPSYY